MTEALKSFIERNIDLIEDRKFEELYDNAYDSWLNNLGIMPMDIRDLTGVLSDVFDDEPIFDANLTHVPSFYRLATDNLRHLEIPEGIEYIGKAAFKNCINLNYLKLPRSLRRIADEAFKGCDNLDEIFYDGSKADWERIQLDMQAFGSTGWIHQYKTVYCNDGEVII